ncbi:hypothetical protein [Prosthecobacter sp.]|jgi:hypothetical protein
MKMNALLKTLGFLALAATPVLAGTSPAPKNPVAPAPENDDLGITASLGYDTNYIWRGLNYGQNWVRSAAEGSILLIGGASEDGAGTTSLDWNAQFGTLAGDQEHFTPNFGADDFGVSFQRLQLGAAVAHDFGPATVSLGYTYYRNMGTFTRLVTNDGGEINLGLATSLGPIDIASSANFDHVNNSWYFDVNASTTIAITDSISLVPFANVGYGHNLNWQFAADSGVANGSWGGLNNITGWTAITTGIQLPIKLNSRATLTPYLAGNLPLGTTANLGGSARDAGAPDTPYKSVLFGGVTLSVRF